MVPNPAKVTRQFRPFPRHPAQNPLVLPPSKSVKKLQYLWQTRVNKVPFPDTTNMSRPTDPMNNSDLKLYISRIDRVLCRFVRAIHHHHHLQLVVSGFCNRETVNLFSPHLWDRLSNMRECCTTFFWRAEEDENCAELSWKKMLHQFFPESDYFYVLFCFL